MKTELKYKPDKSLRNLLNKFQPQNKLAEAIDNMIDETAFNSYKESYRNLEDDGVLNNGLAANGSVVTDNNNVNDNNNEIDNVKTNKRKVWYLITRR